MENFTLAGVGNRFLAHFIDGIILTAVVMILMMIFGGAMMAGMSAVESGEMSQESAVAAFVSAYLGMIVLIFAIQILYFTFMDSTPKGTIGKRALKIRVVTQDGRTMTRGESFLRAIGKVLSGLICSIGFIIAFFSKDEKALHDIMAKTSVVKA